MPGHETPHPAPAGATPARRRGGAPRASVSFVSDGPISSNSGRNGGKNAGRNCVSALPQRATLVHCRPRFPSRNRRFPDRCRSPDCASTAFRCRCLLLRQKLFVLPCRRLRNNYILCPTGTPTFAALRRQRRDLIIAKTVQRTRSYSRTAVSGSGASALFVSDGDSFAPRRELLLSAVTKVAKSTGRNCVSALPQRAILSCDFLRILAGIAFCRRCRIKGLCLRSPARRLTRPLASATAEIFRSYRHPLQAFPLRGPRGDRCPHIPAALAATYPLRCFAPQWARFDNRHSTSAPTPTLTAVSGSGASGTSDP